MTQRLPNVRLRDTVAEAGWTYAALAHAVRQVAAEAGELLRTNKSAVDHWIAGTMPSGNTGRYLTIALSRRLGRTLTPQDLGLPAPAGWENDGIGLSIGQDPLDTLVPIWRGDLDRRRFLSGAAYSVAAAVLPLQHVGDIASRAAKARTGARVGHADVAAVRDMVAMFAVMDERHGGQHGRSALVQYLMSDVAALCRGRFSSEDDHRHMLSAAAVGVHQAGWRAYDGGEQGLAQRYYLQSYALAHESGITGHDAFVMRTMSQQGMKLHRPEHCLALAATAVDKVHGRVDTQTEALFAVTHAHALAKAGPTTGSRAGGRAGPHRPGLGERRRCAVLGAVVGTAGGHGVQPVGEGLRDARGPAQGRGDVRSGGGEPANGHLRPDRRPGPGRPGRDAGRRRQRRAGLRHLGPGHRPHGRRAVGRTRKAVATMRRDLSRFRARGLRCAFELDERAREFLLDRC